jgi:hypothetical protein
MGTGYTRNDTPNNIADGNVINASDLDGEFDAVQAAFNGSTGHSHDGTTGEGPQIATAGLADNAVTTAKITDSNVTTAKINNGAVTSAKLDTNIQIAGTLGVTGVSSFANGTNSAPSLTFASDTNTGIYRGGTDILKFVTAGTDAITIDASQNVDIVGTLQVGVDGTTAGEIRLMDSGSVTEEATISSDANGGLIFGGNSGAGELIFRTGSSTKRMDISSGGDISFYEDTGTTAKFFWDASAESLGIGTTSMTELFEIHGDTPTIKLRDTSAYSFGTGPAISFQGKDNAESIREFGNIQGISRSTDNGELAFSTRLSGTLEERVRIDQSGNVGIGTDSPTFPSGTGLVVHNASASRFKLTVDATGQTSSDGFELTASGSDAFINNRENGNLIFYTNSTQAATIDNSQNFMVGTTNSLAGINNTDEGISLRTSTGSASSIVVSRDAGVSGYFNRNSDGDVLSLRKDGSAVGTIGVTGTVLKINSTNSGIYVGGTSAVIYPQTDNAHNLGTSSLRFQDLYLSGGVYLGGTGSANYLDDYEEGTWTPSVSSGFTLDSTTTAVYRKIGDIVHVFGSITVDVTNGTEAVLAGLPFNCAVGNEAVLISFNNVSTFEYIPRARTNASLPQLKFNPQVTANNVQIMIQATYRTS